MEPWPQSRKIKGRHLKAGSGDVVLSARREDIDHARILDRGCAVFHATAHHQGVPRSKVELVSLASDPDMTMHYIHDLIVRMAMRCAPPAFHHLMLGKKQLVVIREHTAFQPAFRRGLLAFFARYHHEVRKRLCSGFHLLSPYYTQTARSHQEISFRLIA